MSRVRKHYQANFKANVTLSAQFGRVDVEDCKVSARQHADERTFSAKIIDWCEDSLELLDLLCELMADKKLTKTNVEAPPFGRGGNVQSAAAAGPGCDTLDACPLNGPAMRCTTRHIIWCGLPNIGNGLPEKISGDRLTRCSVRLRKTLGLSLTNWRSLRTMSTSF